MEIVQCMKQAADALSRPLARPQSPCDDVTAFCNMIKSDLRKIPLLARKKLMHKFSGLIIEALEPLQQQTAAASSYQQPPYQQPQHHATAASTYGQSQYELSQPHTTSTLSFTEFLANDYCNL